MKSLSIITFTGLTMLGCAHHPDYQLGASYDYVNEIQVLDPEAPERNDGITTALDGKYGQKVMKIYQNSAYDVKSARDIKHIRSRR